MVDGISLIKRGKNRKVLTCSSGSPSGVLFPWFMAPSSGLKEVGVHGLWIWAAPLVLAQNDVNFTSITKEAVNKPKAIFLKGAKMCDWNKEENRHHPPTQRPQTKYQKDLEPGWEVPSSLEYFPSFKPSSLSYTYQLYFYTRTLMLRDLAPAESSVATDWQNLGWNLNLCLPATGCGLCTHFGFILFFGVGGVGIRLCFQIRTKDTVRLNKAPQPLSSPLLTWLCKCVRCITQLRKKY